MPTPPLLTLTIEEMHATATATVFCHGKLLAGDTDLLHLPVSQLITTHRHVILDLGGLTQMDSMGLGALVRLYVSARARGSTLELRNLGKKVRELLIMTNLFPILAAMGDHGTRM